MLVVTDDGFANHDDRGSPQNIHRMFGFSCPSTTTCFAAGSLLPSNADAVVSTKNGGVKWKTHDLPSGVKTKLGGVACPSTQICYVAAQSVHYIMATTNGGSSWKDQKLPESAFDLQGIACPTTSTCIVSGAGAVVTTNSGSNWKASKFPGGWRPYWRRCMSHAHSLRPR